MCTKFINIWVIFNNYCRNAFLYTAYSIEHYFNPNYKFCTFIWILCWIVLQELQFCIIIFVLVFGMTLKCINHLIYNVHYSLDGLFKV